MARLRIYFCTLDTCVAYYLVAAHQASDCFDVIDKTQDIRAVMATPSKLQVEYADQDHLTEHGAVANDGKSPLLLSDIERNVALLGPEDTTVLWRKLS